MWHQGLEKPRAGVVDMPDTKDIGIWSNAFREWALPFMRMAEVTDVASEAPILAVHHKEDDNGAPVGRGHIDLTVVVFHVGILVTIEQVRAELGLPPVRRYVRSSVAKHFTGSGKGKRVELKSRFIVACQRQGWNVTDENMADACGVLDIFCYDLDQATPWDCSPRKPLFEDSRPKMPTQAEKVASAKLINKALSFNARRTGT